MTTVRNGSDAAFPVVHDLDARALTEIVGGALLFSDMPPRDGDAAVVSRIVTDSRQVQPGDLFWALAGGSCDGADFAYEAYMRGATGIVARRRVEPWAGRWSLIVPDPMLALWELARWKRARFRGTIIGVAGAVGKTITRHLIHTVLKARFSGTVCPQLEHPRLGIPLGMLSLDPLDDYAVVELSAGAPSDSEARVKLCQPTIGVVASLGGLPLVRAAADPAASDVKRQLLAALPESGWAELPGDEPLARKAAADVRARIVWFGRRGDCDVAATDVECRRGYLRFAVDKVRFCVPVWGRHYLPSVLAAYAVGRVFELPPDEIADALSEFDPPPVRCQVSEAAGVTFVDDTYNASSAAMQAALEVLRDCPATRRVVVCGELDGGGDLASALHRQIGEQIVTLCGADLVVACGRFARDVVTGARDAGIPLRRAVACRQASDAVALLANELTSGDAVLVKGRSAPPVERIVAARTPHPERLVA
jgi:UDP-N-acetylmuramoyl-tripeptide--D-alanyl-D-alanine ligase